MSKRVLISIVVLIVSACLVLSLLAAAGVIAFLRIDPARTGVQTQPQPTAELAPAPTKVPEPATQPADPSAPAEGGEIPADVLGEMRQIEEQTEENRGLTFSGELQRSLLTPDQLRQRVMDDFLQEYTPEDMDHDQQVMSIFGLLPRDYDIKALYTELYSEQIAGFYDDETNEMVVVQGQGFNGPERATYAHEFTHALQDEAYDLTNGLKTDEETCRKDSEYCAAVQSLIEGDATLSEQLWLLYSASSEDRDQLDEFYSTYESPVYDSAPEFLQQDFTFPYDKGVYFVLEFYQKGGYAAVDKLYQDPPVSTEQILHPERYPDDKPVKIELPDYGAALGTDWEEIDRNTVGEWYACLILAFGDQPDTRLDEDEALRASEGWGGDGYVVYSKAQPGQTALVYVSQWDSKSDAREFWLGFQQYARQRWGNPDASNADQLSWASTPDGAVLLRRNADGQVLWVIAPDAAAVNQLGAQTPGFGQ